MKRSLFLLPAVLIAGAATAQDAFDFRVSDLRLLQAKQVQSDLGITAAQRARLNVAADAHKARLTEYQKQLQALGTTNPDKARLGAFLQTLKKEALAVLTPGQLARLRGITLQRLGLVSLTDDGVASRVGLSAAQVGRIKAAFQAGRTRFLAVQQSARAAAAPIAAQYKDRKPKTPTEAAALQKEVEGKVLPIRARFLPQLQAVGKQTDADMLAVLSAPQRVKWAALKGRPFTAK